MPSLPKVSNKKLADVKTPEILNAMRSSGYASLENAPAVQVGDLASLRAFGDYLLNYEPAMNDFINAVNRISLVLVTSKLYANPLAGFKRGLLEFGETVEELFVDIARGFQYDIEESVTGQYKRVKPDVKAAFHTLNYMTYYKVTVENEELRKAFLSWAGVTDLIAKIVDSMYSAAAYDEQNTILYMVAQAIINGRMGTTNITANDPKNGVTVVKALSNNMTFMSTAYNEAGVHNFTNKEDQYILINATYDASMDVDVLAAAFNIDRVEFMGRRVIIPDFTTIDQTRLAGLIGETFVPIAQDDLAALSAVPIIVLDKDWPMIFDNMYKMTEKYNGEGLYWNYWYHVWKIFSHSPFANAVAVVEGESAVTAVSVTPATATVSPGSTLQLTANVTVTGFANKGVTWASSNTDVTVSSTGLVTVGTAATGTATISATSVVDATKKATATLTIS